MKSNYLIEQEKSSNLLRSKWASKRTNEWASYGWYRTYRWLLFASINSFDKPDDQRGFAHSFVSQDHHFIGRATFVRHVAAAGYAGRTEQLLLEREVKKSNRYMLMSSMI